jgi:hypothetical protein
MPPLTNEKHEAFCIGRAKGLGPAEAYWAAGYKVKAVRNADSAACRLASTNVNVQERLQELRRISAAEALDAVGVTVMAMAEKIRAGLEAKKQGINGEEVDDWANQAKFLDSAAKMRGLYETKVAVRKVETEKLDDLNDQARQAQIEAMAAARIKNGRHARH